MDEPKPEPPPQTEPATPFTWVIVAGVVVWVLGAAIILIARY